MSAYETASAARYLASLGFRVFPISPGLKGGERALPVAWQSIATNDAAQVAQWWPEGSQNNIGVLGGDGRLMLDIDWQKPGCREALAALESQYGALPPTRTISTPRGGEHRYYAAPDVPNSASKIGAGLDIKSAGGYVVGPWSYTVAIPGKQGEGYYRVKDDLPIAQAPAWLVALAGTSRTANVAPRPPAATISSAQLADLRSALAHPALLASAGGHGTWSEIGYALLSLGDLGFELWREFCERAANPNPGPDTAETWWARHARSAPRSDFKRIYALAGDLGWMNPNPAGDPSAIPWSPATQLAGASNVPPPPTAQSAPATPRFALVDAWTFADGPDPLWRIEGLLPEQGLAMVFGASGSGKTFFLLDLSMAIALGVPRYGHDKRRVQPGRVVYIVAEGAGGFRKRLRAYRAYHKLLQNCPAPKLVTVTPNFMNVADVTELQGAILAAGGADVIVVDTLHASSAGADENSAKDMGLFLGHCRALQAATGGLVIVVHHSGKDEERGARGSSALRAAMDTEIEVSGGGGEFSVAHVTKQRDGDTAGSVCFKIVSVPLFGDRAAVSAAVEHIESPVKARKPRASNEQSLAADVVRESYPNGVQLEVLVSVIQQKRGDLRPDNIRRSITRAIDANLLAIDKAQNVRLTQGA